MKIKKNTLRNSIILTLAAIVLVTATVFTTLAYLVSTAKVSNVFTVGDVTLKMYETPVDTNGKHLSGAGKTSDTNSYKIVPGGTYDKDPTIFVAAGSTDSILFVKTRNQISTIETKEAGKTMREQMEKNGWQRVAQMTNGDWIYVYVGKDAPAVAEQAALIITQSTSEQTFPLFTEFSIDKNCNIDNYKLANGAAVTLTAYAIQADGFTTTATVNNETVEYVSKKNVIDAWNAIVDKVPYEESGNKIEYTEQP